MGKFLASVNSYTLNLYFQNDGKMISWSHVEQLYELDSGAATGLSMAHKLKYEHVHLTGFAKMRVDLAAEVTSS
jgi:hypothetical protein